eukprot:GHVN01098420.1.p1 GENE.GHVN01098420.1~~GHVN01098420.1.p1  ORF type:complete len:105 (+),score=14.69 GHVN01098420.1:248-562(+)
MTEMKQGFDVKLCSPLNKMKRLTLNCYFYFAAPCGHTRARARHMGSHTEHHSISPHSIHSASNSPKPQTPQTVTLLIILRLGASWALVLQLFFLSCVGGVLRVS